MRNRILAVFVILIILAAGWYSSRTSNTETNTVTVYTAHDQDYSEPILQKFQDETGIIVKPVFDTEATKTTGLVNRLIAEKNNPQADVFWNNEVSRTIVLQREGVLMPYESPNVAGISALHKDPENFWSGFGARARVLLVNTNLVTKDEYPQTLEELTKEKWRAQAAIANPLFGTAASHMAALYQIWGQEKAEQYLKNLKANNVIIAESNGRVRDMVVDGEVAIGLTDTDDANDAVVDGAAVAVIYPDQDQDQIGTLVIPNTVMLVEGAPHQENAKKLIDFLLSSEVEEMLAESKAAQMPLHSGVETPENVPDVTEIKAMDVTWAQVADLLETSQTFVQEEFVR